MPGKCRPLLLLGLLAVLWRLCSPGPAWAQEAFLPDLRKHFLHGGVRLNYYEFGQGEPLIFLHGFGGASYTWRHLYPALQQDHRVFLMDLKGFGLSARPRDGKYSPWDQAALVASFIEQNRLEEATLIGHSFGGAVALLSYFKVSGMNPSRIKALILIDSAGYPESLPPFLKILRIPVLSSLLSKIIPTRLAVARVLKKSFYDEDKISEEIFQTYLFYNRLPGSAYVAVTTAQQLIPLDIEDMIRRLREIRVPVLLIWGYEDEIIPLAYGFKLHRAIPGSQMVTLKRCGHIPPEEKPGESLAEIAKFLKSPAGPTCSLKTAN